MPDDNAWQVEAAAMHERMQMLEATVGRLQQALQDTTDTQNQLLAGGAKTLLSASQFKRVGSGRIHLNDDGVRVLPGIGTEYEWWAALPYTELQSSDQIELEGAKARMSDLITFSDLSGGQAGDSRRHIRVQAKQVVGVTIGFAGLDLFADDNDGGGYAKLYAITDTLIGATQKGYIRLGQSVDHPEFSVDDVTYQNIALASDLTSQVLLKVGQRELVNDSTTFYDLLGGYNIPANALGTNNMVRFTSYGDYLNNSGATRTVLLQVTYGGTALYSDLTLAIPASATRRAYRLEVTLSAQGSASVQILGGLFALSDTGGAATGLGDLATTSPLVVPISGSAAKDSTTTLQLVVAVQHSAANASLSFRQQYGILELLG